jgi:hypothetical protein
MATGFSLVVRRPYLVFVPILVDIWAWYGPGISAGPLIRQWASKLLSAFTAGPLTPEQMLGVNTQVNEAAEALSQWNVLGILSWQVPTYLGLGSVGNAEGYASVSSLATLVFMVIGLALGGVLLGCIFLAPLAQAVREKTLAVPTLVRDLPGLWLRFTAYLGLLIVAGMVIGIPIALIVGLVTAFNPILASLVVLLAIGGAFLVVIYLFLADEAVIVGGAGPLTAIKASFRIVSRQFWSVLGLFLIVSIISLGLDLVWSRVASTAVGIWGAIIGSAFIATGLAASVMIYYWGRRPSVAGTALSHTENPGLGASEKDG